MLKSGDLPFSAQHGEEKTTMNENNLKEALDKLSIEEKKELIFLLDLLIAAQDIQEQRNDSQA